MDENSLTYKTLRNAFFNFLGYTWPFVFAIFITPIIVFKIGLSTYGNYIFINTLISLASLLDLGIGVATIKYVVEHYSRNEKEELKKTIYSVNWLFFIVGIVGCTFIILGGVFGSSLFHLNSVGGAKTINLFIIAGVTFFFASMSGLGNVALLALQRYDITNKINIISITLSSLSLLVIVMLGYGILGMMISQLFFAVVTFLALTWLAKKALPEARLKFRWDSFYIKRGYKFGLVTVISNISNAALSYLDRLIIPLFIGASSLTFYTLPGNLTNKIPGLANTLSGMLFPLTTNLSSLGEIEKIKTAYIRSFRLLLIFSAAIALSIAFLAKPILLYWLDAEFSQKSSGVLIILAITNLILALSGPLYNFLLGLGKLKLITFSSLIMALVNFILLFVLLPKYGITGAAWSYLLALVPIVYVFYVTESKYLQIPYRRQYYFFTFLKITLVSVISFLIDYYFLAKVMSNKISMILTLGLAILIFLSLYFIFGFFEKEDVRDAKNFTRMFIFKKLFER